MWQTGFEARPDLGRLNEEARKCWSEWVLAFAQDLETRGYALGTIRAHVRVLKRVAVFFSDRGSGPESLNESQALQEYFKEFTADFYRFRGRLPSEGTMDRIRRAPRFLVEFAQQSGRLPAPELPSLPSDVTEFLPFCRVHRGLSESSLADHKKLLLKLWVFLQTREHSEMVGVSLDLLDQFIQEYAQSKSRSRVSHAVSTLRAFLRWLFLVERESDDRSGLLVGPRMYQEMQLPKHLTDEQFEEFLSKVDRTTIEGKQDWAIILLVALLGLRIGEVAALRLDNLDLSAGRLHLRRPKTQRPSMMPLCPELGGALGNYLFVRPETHHQEVFVTRVKPIRPYASGQSLSRRVRKYLTKVKGVPAAGPHALRHTLARRLLQGGTPLPVIRRVLGHTHSGSTGRYLRIATDELAEVANNYAELL